MHRGDGWAVRIPEGAQVRTEGGSLAVDAADGRRWFDVSWQSEDVAPESLAYGWGSKHCSPIMWDQPVEPVPGTWTNGGQCTVHGRRYHAFVAIERHEGGQLLTTYLVEHNRLPYEDAWVDFTSTALTLRGGDTPLEPFDHTVLRTRIRDAAALPPGHLPVAGGGLLSGRISERVPELWQRRRELPPPRSAW